MPHAVVIEALRTPRGSARESGALHTLAPMELLAGMLRAVQERTGVDTAQVADGVFGCVTQTGEQGGNIGKSACLLAGWSQHLSAVTINRYCASGLSAVNWAAQQARDSDQLAVGGGVEMMSRVPMFGDQVPYYTDRALGGRIGFVPPPWSSDLVATREGTTREDCDRYAALSQSRALAARRRGPARSMVPMHDAQGALLLDHDENIREANTLGACRTWGAESENRPQRGQFLPDLQAHSPAMGQKAGEKWTAAVGLQPAIPSPTGS